MRLKLAPSGFVATDVDGRLWTYITAADGQRWWLLIPGPFAKPVRRAAP